MSGPAGDVHDATAAMSALEMKDGEAAEIGGSSQVDLESSGPAFAPVGSGGVHRDWLVDAGVVNQDIYFAVERFERFFPKLLAGTGLREIPGNLFVICRMGAMTQDAGAVLPESLEDAGSDATGGAGDEDVG